MTETANAPEPESENVRHWASIPGGCLITLDDDVDLTIIGALTRRRKGGFTLLLSVGSPPMFSAHGDFSSVEGASDHLAELIARVREDHRRSIEPDFNVYVTRRGYGWRVTRLVDGKKGGETEEILSTLNMDEAIAKAREIAPDPEKVVVDEGEEW